MRIGAALVAGASLYGGSATLDGNAASARTRSTPPPSALRPDIQLQINHMYMLTEALRRSYCASSGSTT